MAKKPGPGHNSGDLSREAIIAAMAFSRLHDEAVKKASDARKLHRKGLENQGFVLEHYDKMRKMSEQPISAIKQWFRSQAQVFAVLLPKIGESYDLFGDEAAGTSGAEDTKLAAFRHAGLMKGLEGARPAPQENFAAEEVNAWLEGHREGTEQRRVAYEMSGMEDPMIREAAAQEQKAATPAAEQVRQQAAADFQEDNKVVPLRPADREEDAFARQVREVAATEGERPDNAPAGTADGGFSDTWTEGSPEELASQTLRRVEQDDESEVDVDAAAKKLAESGFVPEKKPRGRPRKVH